MRMQEFEHRPIIDQAPVVQPVHDLVMREGGAALVHDLGLLLGIEVLRDVAHDADQLALPALELGRALLDEVEKILLGQAELAAAFRPASSASVGSATFGPVGTVRHKSL